MSTATAAPGQDPPKQEATRIPSGATIAVVDEDVWRVRHLSELLQKSGFRVLLLTSSTNAVQLVDPRCDVVLVAENLRGLSEIELGRALREKHGDKRPWLVLLGDHAGEPRADFDVVLARPVEDDMLVAALVEAVVARRASTAVPAIPVSETGS